MPRVRVRIELVSDDLMEPASAEVFVERLGAAGEGMAYIEAAVTDALRRAKVLANADEVPTVIS